MLRKNLIKIGAFMITTFNCINVLSNLTVVKADQLPSISTSTTSANFDNNKSDINKADIYSDQTKLENSDYSTVEEIAKKLDSENPLGVASTFHIFSKNANLNADTNGNIATKNLDSHVDFGTRGDNKTVNHTEEDINYIENINNIDSMNHSAFRNTHDHVVLSDKMTVNVNQDHRVVINQDGKETYIESNNLSQDEIHVLDKDHKYIDIDAELNKLTLKSNNWNKKTNSEGVKIDLHDMNNQIIDIRNTKADDNNLIYVNLDSHLLAQPQPIKIKGLENGKKENPIVIINVKSDTHKLNVATQTLLFYRDSNQTINNSESHTEKNYLLWNFGTNIDKINFNSGRFMGSILAPHAEISANVNIDGNIVADTVNISGGESHRWDLTNNGHPSFPNDDYIINPPDPDDQREHPLTPIAPHDDTILNHKRENGPVLNYDLPKFDLDKLKKKDSGPVLDYDLPTFDLNKLKKKNSGTVLDYDLPKFELDKLKKRDFGPVLDYDLPTFDLNKLKKKNSGPVLDYDLPTFDLNKLKKKDSGPVLDYDLPTFDLDKLKK
ncbi:collagen-binding domain-containing protein, partial [Lactobacillus intestinalis]